MTQKENLPTKPRRVWLLTLLIFIILAAAFVFIFKSKIAAFSQNKEKQRQAIFLTNGQVYFGVIQKENEHYLVICDIYYLQTQDQLSLSNADKKVSIIKLGDEVHGPADQMYINRDQVLFYESMRDDSKINEAIKKYVSSKNVAK